MCYFQIWVLLYMAQASTFKEQQHRLTPTRLRGHHILKQNQNECALELNKICMAMYQDEESQFLLWVSISRTLYLLAKICLTKLAETEVEIRPRLERLWSWYTCSLSHTTYASVFEGEGQWHLVFRCQGLCPRMPFEYRRCNASLRERDAKAESLA